MCFTFKTAASHVTIGWTSSTQLIFSYRASWSGYSMDHLPVTLFLVLVACAIYYKCFYRVSLSQIQGPSQACIVSPW